MSSLGSWPIALTVAGSDSGGGAGIQADLRAFSYFSAFGTTAITAITAQNQAGVTGIEAVSPKLVSAQIQAVLDGFPVAAIKTGMLFSPGIVEAVVFQLQRQQLPLVVDPVMVASSGAVLLQDRAIDTIKRLLLPISTVFTPNLPEAEVLLQARIPENETARLQAAFELHRRYGTAIVLKGGHGGGREAVDFLVADNRRWRFSSDWIESSTSHGTGCLFSAGLAACLARREELPAAVAKAKAMVNGFLDNCLAAGDKASLLVPPAELPLAAVVMTELE